MQEESPRDCRDCSSARERGSPAMSRREMERCFSGSEERSNGGRMKLEMQSRESPVMPL